jgi:hypothetical protein
VAGSTYDTLQQKKTELIRKALNGSVFTAAESAAAITALTDTADSLLKPLPTGYGDLGWLTDDGAQYSRSADTSDVTSWGSTEPTRSDVTKDTTTLQVSCQETKLSTIGLYIGVDTAGITPDASSGEVQIAKPATPKARFYRVLSVAVDESDDGEIYIARFLPRAKVTDYADQKQSNGDDPVLWGVTFTSFVDSTLGFSEKHIFGGPGWKALLASMGWSVGT